MNATGNAAHKRRKIRKTLAVGIMGALMIALLVVGFGSMNTAQKAEKELGQANYEAMDLLELREQLILQREQILQMALAKTSAERRALRASIQKRSHEIDAILDTFAEMAREDEGLSRQLKELTEVRAASRQTREQEVIPFILAGQNDKALRLLKGIQQQRFDKMRSLAKAIASNAQDKAFQQSLKIGRQADRAFLTFVVTSLLALLLGIGIVLILARPASVTESV